MPNPLNFISPAINLLGNNLNILPASGGAVEDLQRPDADEIDDLLINRSTGEITDFLETPAPTLTTLYRPTPPIFRKHKHLFRFFIDGSLRTYYLATGIESNRSFPIELAQIGASVMQRADNGRVKTLGGQTRFLLLAPKGQQGLSDTLWQQLERTSTSGGDFEVIDTVEDDAISGKSTDDLRNKAGGKARHRMHKLEIAMIDLTNGLRNDENWLILDGAVKLDEFIKTPYMIGVAKNFSKTPQFYFGRKRGDHKDVTAILAGLPCAHRTVAFSSHDGKVAFWYVRLREQKELDYPLMGVVKVEYPRPDQKPVEADLADLLSSALVAERNVTPYGRDNRWHCHLYPIFLAEEAIKNRFYSKEVLMGAIRWPKPKPIS